MAVTITFPVFDRSVMTLEAQHQALNEWVDEQQILTIENWGIKHNTVVYILLAFPEQIQADTEARLQAEFYEYLQN